MNVAICANSKTNWPLDLALAVGSWHITSLLCVEFEHRFGSVDVVWTSEWTTKCGWFSFCQFQRLMTLKIEQRVSFRMAIFSAVKPISAQLEQVFCTPAVNCKCVWNNTLQFKSSCFFSSAATDPNILEREFGLRFYHTNISICRNVCGDLDHECLK